MTQILDTPLLLVLSFLLCSQRKGTHNFSFIVTVMVDNRTISSRYSAALLPVATSLSAVLTHTGTSPLLILTWEVTE